MRISRDVRVVALDVDVIDLLAELLRAHRDGVEGGTVTTFDDTVANRLCDVDAALAALGGAESTELVDPTRLAALAELARELGIGRTRLGNWARRYPDFPAPVTVLACGSVYDKDAVAAWRRRHTELRG